MFLVGQFQDEQTGGHFAESARSTLNGNPNVWITLQNGVHADSLGPSTITRWAEFLNLYVADEIPVVPPSVIGLSGALYKYLADARRPRRSRSRASPAITDVAAAKAEFKKDPRVRLLMDNGGGTVGPGSHRRDVGARLRLVAGEEGTGDAVLPRRRRHRSRRAAQRVRRRPATRPTREARPRQTLPGHGAATRGRRSRRYDWAPVADGQGPRLHHGAARRRRRHRRPVAASTS